MSTSLEHGASSCCGVREGHCAAVMGIVWWGGHPRCSTAWKLVEAIVLSYQVMLEPEHQSTKGTCYIS